MLERSRERLKGDTVRKVLLLGLLERGLALSSGLWLCQLLSHGSASSSRERLKGDQLLSHGSASSSRERLKGDQLLSQFGISFPYQLSTSISCTFLLTNGLGPPSTRGRYHIHNLYLGVLAVFFLGTIGIHCLVRALYASNTTSVVSIQTP